MTKDEALKMAIEVMDNIEIPFRQYADEAINACKKALEQPELIKNITLSCGCKSAYFGFPSEWDGYTGENQPCLNYGVLCEKHYEEYDARPAQQNQQQWQGLTNDEIWDIANFLGKNKEWDYPVMFAKTIEQALKDKNT